MAGVRAGGVVGMPRGLDDPLKGPEPAVVWIPLEVLPAGQQDGAESDKICLQPGRQSKRAQRRQPPVLFRQLVTDEFTVARINADRREPRRLEMPEKGDGASPADYLQTISLGFQHLQHRRHRTVQAELPLCSARAIKIVGTVGDIAVVVVAAHLRPDALDGLPRALADGVYAEQPTKISPVRL